MCANLRPHPHGVSALGLLLLLAMLGLGCESAIALTHVAGPEPTSQPPGASESSSSKDQPRPSSSVSEPLDAITGATRLRGDRARALDRQTSQALESPCPSKPPAEVSFYLTKSAWVRVRVLDRRRAGIIYRTLWSWRERSKGRQRIGWDGRDESGRCFDKSHAFVEISLAEPQSEVSK